MNDERILVWFRLLSYGTLVQAPSDAKGPHYDSVGFTEPSAASFPPTRTSIFAHRGLVATSIKSSEPLNEPGLHYWSLAGFSIPRAFCGFYTTRLLIVLFAVVPKSKDPSTIIGSPSLYVLNYHSYRSSPTLCLSGLLFCNCDCCNCFYPALGRTSQTSDLFCSPIVVSSCLSLCTCFAM